MEMMVAVALFTIVMTVSMGALLALIDANKKAQATQSVMNNLNIALDGMVRAIRMGTEYHCGDGPRAQYLTQNCLSTYGTKISFEPYYGDPNDNTDYWSYWLELDGGIGRIKKRYKDATGVHELYITAKEIDIEKFEVYVRGADKTLFNSGPSNSDALQPFVTLVVKGVAGSVISSPFSTLGFKKKVQTKFHIQTAASQRLLDL